MPDFAEHPGRLFVVATLLPLASFLVVILFLALRAALRQSPEGSAGAALYQTLGGDRSPRWPAWLATLAIGAAFVCCAAGSVMFLQDQETIHKAELGIDKIGNDPSQAEKVRELQADVHDLEHRWKESWNWITVGYSEGKETPSSAIKLGYKIDHLNLVMFLMVTFVATLIHLFSIGYMADEAERTVEDHQVHGEHGHHYTRRGRFARFFLFLSLFCFSMLNLILADNLFQVFLSWELVGICSYLLIGYYFERQSASNAANKAFITNRVGDAGFILGLLIVWTYVGSFNFDDVFARLRAPEKDQFHSSLQFSGQFVRAEPAGANEMRVTTGSKDLAPGSLVVLWPVTQSADYHAPHPNDTRDIVPSPALDQSKFEGDKAEAGELGAMPYWVLVVAGLGIFLGCVGKSAQFPLQVWLPDAMEGPTPVSALIHAATMVAAGVYLVGRCYPIFAAEALLVIAYTGAITLFLAATIAVVVTDIKKVLAYSTVSQLGYMMLALGVGGWVAGLFHLVTHAFFKALLFLGSGSVIHGCHHEQDMTKMGGLYDKMKITALTMLMGVLAIAGIPAFSGWYSKDAVIAQAMGYAALNPQHLLLFLLPLLTAGLTTFYMFRMWLMTFTGKPRDHHVYEHAHESPPLMTGPLVVLAVLSVCVAWGASARQPFLSPHFPFINAEASLLEHTIHHAQPASVQADFGTSKADTEAGRVFASGKAPPQSERVKALELHHLAGNLALGMVALGMSFAFVLYYWRRLDAAEAKSQVPGLARFLEHKWYFDELYSAAVVRPVLAVGHFVKRIDARVLDGLIDGSARTTVRFSRREGKFDSRIIDGLVNLVGRVADGIGGWFRTWQTGYLRSYVLFLVMAAVGLFVVLSYLMTAGG